MTNPEGQDIGSLEGVLVAVSVGSLAVGEVAHSNTLIRYITAGVAAISGAVLFKRLEQGEPQIELAEEPQQTVA